ncbi:MAG: MFS transporter [Pirellulaceae bacterium]
MSQIAESRTIRRPIQRESAPVEPDTRLYYGWVMLPLAIIAVIASGPGQTFGVSIFNESIRETLSLTHSQLALAYTLGTVIGAVPILFFGWMMDRFGMRRTMLMVVTLFSGACLIMAVAQNWWMLLLAFCLLRMLGPGALAFGSGNTLAYWFDRRLGTVEGIRQLGMAASMTVIPMINLWLITNWGWRGAYLGVGTFLWLLLFPLFWLLFRNKPSDVGQEMEGARRETRPETEKDRSKTVIHGLTLGQTIRTPTFYIVGLGTALFGLVQTAIFFCLTPIFAERGMNERDAALMLTAFALSLGIMQLVGGTLADRMKAPGLLVVGMLCMASGVWLLNSASTPLWGSLAGIVMGAAQGIYFGTAHPLWARYFGRRHLGKIRGVLMTVNVASSSLGPLFAGLTRDYLGSFSLALWAFALLPLPFALASLWVAPPGEMGNDSETPADEGREATVRQVAP